MARGAQRPQPRRQPRTRATIAASLPRTVLSAADWRISDFVGENAYHRAIWMISERDLETLLDFADQSPWRLPDGGWVVVHVERVDVTGQRPHGIRYGLVVQDANKQRVLGFDNSHGFDGAADDDPFDHEHPLGRVERRIRYDFRSPSALLADFFDRCAAYCAAQGMSFDLQPEGDQ